MLTRIKSALWGLRQGFNLPLADWERMLDMGDFGVESSAGVHVSEHSGSRLATAFACINILSRDMAALPLKMYERRPDGGRKEIKDHKVARWLAEPNDVQTPLEFRQRAWFEILTRGNDFCQVSWTRSGEDFYTYPLRPTEKVEVKIRHDRRKEFELHRDGEVVTLSAGKVLHSFGLSINGGYSGVSPIRHCMETFGRAQAVGEYGASFFKSPIPKVVIKADAAFKDEAAKAAFLKNWKEKFSGKRGNATVAIMPPGMDVSQIVKIPNNEAQFIETHKLSTAEIARIYLVPLHRLQELDRATFSNIEHQSLEYVVYTLMPWLIALEQKIEAQFLTREERDRYFIRHSVDGLLRGDYETRMKGHALAIQWGLSSINEARGLENLPTVDGGDDIIVPLNMVKLKDLEAPEPKDEPQEDDPADDAARALRSGFEIAEFRAAAERRKIAQRYQPKIRVELEKLARQEAEAVNNRVGTLLRAEARTVDEFNTWVAAYFAERSGIVRRAVRGVMTQLAADTAAAVRRETGDDAELPEAFVDSYSKTFADRWTGSARAQLQNLAVEADVAGDDPAEAVGQRVDEWMSGGQGASRAAKAARREAFTLANAVAVVQFNMAGRGARWVTFGKNCPYCDSLSGKRVAPGESFVPVGDYQPAGADRPLRIRGFRKHPPIHGGCDCMVAPG